MFGLLLSLVLILCVLAIIVLIRLDRPLLAYAQGHWHQNIAGLTGTTHDFYRAVQAVVARIDMPGVVTKVVPFHEGGVFTDRRDYLRVRRGEHVFDLCVAPFGQTLFVSSWLSENPGTFVGVLSRVPLLGLLVRAGVRLLDPPTYYKVDSLVMFQETVHACVLHVLDEMITDQGLEPLPESARKPVMRELYSRKGTPVAA